VRGAWAERWKFFTGGTRFPAAKSARAGRVPGGAWVGLFLLVALAALAIGARLLVPGPLHLPRI